MDAYATWLGYAFMWLTSAIALGALFGFALTIWWRHVIKEYRSMNEIARALDHYRRRGDVTGGSTGGKS